MIVLAGSLLTRVPAVGEPVRASLRQRWPAAELAGSGSGEAGATALAPTAVGEAARAAPTDASVAAADVFRSSTP